MAVSELLMEGVNLMLLGMGSVFIFLAVLVVALNGMSKLAAAIGIPEAPKAATSGSTASEDDAELVAVISAAINMFKSKK